MALRGRRADGANYDSVLDTMTNVVGILIIVVAVTQLNVSSAVDRARAAMIASGEAIDHPPVSDAEIAIAGKQRKDAEKRLAELEGRWGRMATSHEENERAWRGIAKRLGEASKKKTPGAVRAATRKVARELERVEAEIKRLEDQIRRTSKAIQLLKQQLEELEKRKVDPAPPLEMRLPDPDARRSEKLEPAVFLVKAGKVYEWNVRPLLDDAIGDLKMARGVPPPVLEEAHYKWVADYWNARRYSNGTIRIRFRALRVSLMKWDLVCTVELDRHAVGVPLSALRGKRSAFHQRLAELDRAKEWLLFRVYDDSFEAYLTARSLAEERNFAVGWEPMATGESYRFSVTGRGGGKPLKAD